MSLAAVGEDGSDIPSRQEAEQLLDDPNPKGEIQRGFALRYLDYVEEDPTAYGFRDESDFNAFKEKYKERLSISDGDLFRSLAGAEDDVKYYYTKAKEGSDQLREDARQGDREAVNSGARALEAVRGRSSETSPGAANSNDVLDAGLPGLRAFEVWLPLYNRALGAAGGGAAATIEEVYRLYDEQRDIPFARFDAVASEFTTLRDAVVDSSTDVEVKLQGTFSSWQGAAADRAREYQQGFKEDTSLVADAVGNSAEGLRRTLGSVGKFCEEKANWVLTYYFDSVGDVSAQDMERLLRVAEGSASQNDIIHCIGFLSIEAKNRFNGDWGDLDQDTVNFIAGQAGVWLGEVFCKWFGEHLNNYRMMCANIRVAVDGAWSTFSEMLTQLPENPYSEFGASVSGQDSLSSRPALNDDRSSSPGVDSGGGAVAPPGSGGTANGVTAPTSIAVAEAPPAEPLSGTSPLAGKPQETDLATVGAEVIDQVTGEAVTDPESEPDVLTVARGDHEISLSAPLGDGTLEITVDDGSGGLRNYPLDFAESEHDSEVGRAEAFDPEGVEHGDQPYRPGPDGKIHIEDGDLRITVERPYGPDGPTVTTVDDGSGEPTTYTLGEELRPGQDNQDPAVASDAAPVVSDSAASEAWSGASRESDQTTAPQSASGFDAVVDGAAVSGGSPGSVPDDLDASVPMSGATVGEVAPPPAPQRAGLGVAPGGGETVAAVGGQDTATSSGGMGMTGGAGAGGGAAGGDQERSSSAYRVDGNIFDVGDAGNRISGTLDLDENRVLEQRSSGR